MQLTKHTDYAIRVLIYLNTQVDNAPLAKATDIAELFGISFNHLTKVIHHLGKAGFIQTVRGKSGGIKLAKSADLINLGNVIEVMETTLAPVNCQDPPCRLNSVCLVKPIFHKAMQAFLDELRKHSLADICIAKTNDVWKVSLDQPINLA
ncbi:BadM/Rrf2 family transcriptional regulator [Psychromonas sp. B3M02]|uniref:RrF2 family transcriptional regulator n=1 Tax=unclassified Psychromonas TaxID=2614957 RepID=UPI000DEBC08B|nr:Rrf2 family transcriptional regulator [Psychromonas sp. B3M02]RBW46798.1 BadM/Rrf2 family transcriptional regulator [Psychromonas sp. B3M02]